MTSNKRRSRCRKHCPKCGGTGKIRDAGEIRDCDAPKQDRGFRIMDAAKHRAIASQGGKTAHESGRARQYDSNSARAAGRLGGLSVSANRTHMARIGSVGGMVRVFKLRYPQIPIKQPDFSKWLKNCLRIKPIALLVLQEQTEINLGTLFSYLDGKETPPIEYLRKFAEIFGSL